MVLRASRRKWTITLVISASVTAGMVAAWLDHQIWGLIGAVSVLLFTLFAAGNVLVPGELRIQPEGIAVAVIGQRTHLRWTDITSFAVVPVDWTYGWSGSLTLGHVVRVGVSDRYTGPLPGIGGWIAAHTRAADRALFGGTAFQLPDTYGMPAGQLAALLEKHRRGASASGD